MTRTASFLVVPALYLALRAWFAAGEWLPPFAARALARSAQGLETPLLWVAAILAGLWFARHRTLAPTLLGLGAALAVALAWRAQGPGWPDIPASRVAGFAGAALAAGYGVAAASRLRGARR